MTVAVKDNPNAACPAFRCFEIHPQMVALIHRHSIRNAEKNIPMLSCYLLLGCATSPKEYTDTRNPRHSPTVQQKSCKTSRGRPTIEGKISGIVKMCSSGLVLLDLTQRTNAKARSSLPTDKTALAATRKSENPCPSQNATAPIKIPPPSCNNATMHAEAEAEAEARPIRDRCPNHFQCRLEKQQALRMHQY